MKNDVYIKKLSSQYSTRFGNIAVDMGFITEKQLKKAITEQVEYGLSNSRYKLIGSILYEHGWITREQIDVVLCELFEQK